MKDIKIISHIQKALKKEPRILAAYIFGSYAKDENKANSFEAYISRYYYDTQHLRNIYNYYLKEKFNLKQYGNR